MLNRLDLGGYPKTMSPSPPSQMSWSPWHQRLHKTLVANPALLPKGASLLLSVSGGQDSMALLKLIIDLQRLHEWQIQIWHGDHGWHKNSKQVASELHNWCQEQNLCFLVDSTSKEHTKNEEEARIWRYTSLTNAAHSLSAINQESPCLHVLTGHTGSDRAETVLMNLARGSDLGGLSSMPKLRRLKENILLVRPMLIFSRKETAQICKEMRLPVWLDPSNANLNLSRNRIRHEVVPVLEQIHPGCSIRIAALAERLSHQKKDQEAIALMALQVIKQSDGISRKNLCLLPLTARATVLASWIKEAGIDVLSTSQLDEISRKVETKQPPGCIHLRKGWSIKWGQDLVKLEHSHK